MTKLPYPGFSPRDNDWLYVYDRQLVYYGDNTSAVSRDLLLKETMQQIKDSGTEAYELFGDPAAKAEQDLAQRIPARLKTRYGLVASPAAVLGAGATYLGMLGLFASVRLLIYSGLSFDLTARDLALPLVLTLGITTLLGFYALLTSGLPTHACTVLGAGAVLVSLGLAVVNNSVLVSGFPTPVFFLLLALPAVLWWRWRVVGPQFAPVLDSSAWYRRFAGVVRFRYRVSPQKYLAEVREHCSLTGATPQEEFGHPELYAYELEGVYPQWSKKRRTTAIATVAVLALVALVGFGFLDNEWANPAFFALTNLLFFGQYTNLNRKIPEVSAR